MMTDEEYAEAMKLALRSEHGEVLFKVRGAERFWNGFAFGICSCAAAVWLANVLSRLMEVLE